MAKNEVKPCSTCLQLISRWHYVLCTIFTILLTLWNSEQKNGLLKKLFCFSSDFDKTRWGCSIHGYYNFTKFHQNRMKNKKVFLIAHFWPISALYGPTAAQWGRTPAQCGKLSLWTYVYDYKPILHWKCCSYNFIIQVAPSLSKTAILLVVLLLNF